MDIVISNTSETPIYRQIFEQLRSQIIKGELKSDLCLPPIRTVAKELRISVITIKKAWEELERGGYIYTITGKGCFVAPLHDDELTDKRQAAASDRLKKDLGYYKSLGYTLEELVELIKSAY